MLHALTTTASLWVSHPHWLLAQTYSAVGHDFLLVYRSPLLKVTDSEYEPVLEFLAANETQVLDSGTEIDSEMMFGEAEVTIYHVGPPIEGDFDAGSYRIP